MLPFHKRPRHPSEIEIEADELEPVQLPAVRPPSSRPAPLSSRPAPLSSRPARLSSPVRPSRPALSFASYGDDEQTVLLQKRPTLTPPRETLDFRSPRIPLSPRAPHFGDDEPATQIRTGHQVLSMGTPSVVVEAHADQSGRHEVTAPSSHRVLPDQTSAQRALPEPPKSAAAVDLSMTMGGSIAPAAMSAGRPAPIWAAALLALGVFGGLVTAVLARGDGGSSMASLVDPSHVTATADLQPAVAHAAAALPGVAAGAAAQISHPAASCVPNAVPQQTVKSVTKAPEPKADEDTTAAADTKADDSASHVVAPVHVAPAHKTVVAARPVTKPAAPKPAVHHAPAHHVVVATHHAAPHKTVHVTHHASHGDELDSASAADALAKAQLEAALGE